MEENDEIAAMRKFIKRLVYILMGIAIALWVVTLTPYDYLFKGVYATYLHGHKSATINDKVYFDTDLIRAEAPKEWATDISDEWKPSAHLDSVLKVYESVAFAVFKSSELRYAEFWDGASDTSRTNSFSMAKTITVMLAEIAIENGDLKGWNQKAIELLPELKGTYAGDLTIHHLSTMTAGLDWDEHYTNAFGITAKAYYGNSVYNLMMNKVPVVVEPGSEFEYQSGAMQLLGMCVERATHKSLAELTSKWLWTPLGAQDDAEWHTDDEGQILSYCCFSSNALDFARLGDLLLHNGKWRGKQIIDSAATLDFFKPLGCSYYGRGTWLATVDGVDISYFQGINGQFIIVIPKYDAVIVRLGHQASPVVDPAQRLRVLVDEIAKEYIQRFESENASPQSEW